MIGIYLSVLGVSFVASIQWTFRSASTKETITLTVVCGGILIFQNVILERESLAPCMHWFLAAAAVIKASKSNTQLFMGSSGSLVSDDYIYKPHFLHKGPLKSHLCFKGCFFLCYQCSPLSCCFLTFYHCSRISRCSPVSETDHPIVALLILLISFLLLQPCHTACGGFLDLTSHLLFVCLSDPPDKQDVGFNTQGLPIWSRKLVREKAKSQYQCWVRKVKRERKRIEYDTERRSRLFFLSPVARWGLITTSQPEALSLL